MRKEKKEVSIFLLAFLMGALFLLTLKEFSEKSRPLNVLLFTVDTLRADHLGCYGYSKATSPHIDQLARDGVLCSDTISQSAWTSPGLISILTSLYPPVHKVDSRDSTLSPKIETLPKIMKRWGYTVPNLSYLTSIPNFWNLGYDTPKATSADEEGSFLQWLEENSSKRFFVWFHYRFVHLPYDAPQEYVSLFLPSTLPENSRAIEAVRTQSILPYGNVTFKEEEKPYIEALYDAEVRRLDDFVGKIIEKLQQLDLEGETLFILTADHGEELLDHGFVGHASTSKKGTLHEEFIRIPLLFWSPQRIPRGKVVKAQAQQIDIVPTILDISSLPIPPSLQGQSLLPFFNHEENSSRPAFSETILGGYQSTPEIEGIRIKSIRAGGWKLIVQNGPQGNSYLLYDLVTDPKEKNNLWGKKTSVAKPLMDALSGWSEESRELALSLREGPKLAQEKRKPSESLIPIVVKRPSDGSNLDFQSSRGIVITEWEGDPEASYTIEYDVGLGQYHISGTFAVTGTRQTFGPYPKEVWEPLKAWNPWKFRVILQGHEEVKSPWVTFYF